MISKLCAFNARSEFILSVLAKELALMPGQQIMVLAHNKCLLEYLHDAIAHRQMATVGYYVGGMKEPELKKSETRQIIIATYAMASEALDIKTLTTLVLATPKTDVVQAVGRILRVKHERPLVIDIVDSHEVFLSQWQKRRKYYLQNNYTVMHTKSHLYVLDKWTEQAGTSAAAKASVAAKASASAAGTKKSCSTAKASAAGTKKSLKACSTANACTDLPTQGNLLGKGAAAAARYINTFGTIKHYDDMDEFD
jgi:superfamily II DNA or RNA helicase